MTEPITTLMGNPTAAEVLACLKRAQARIATEQFWCTDNNAEDKDGVIVGAADPSAVRRCGVGALYAECAGHANLLGYTAEPVVWLAINALDRAATALIAQHRIVPTEVDHHKSPICKLNDAPEYGYHWVMRAYETAKAEQRTLAIAG